MRKEAAKGNLDPDKWFNNVKVVTAEKVGIETCAPFLEPHFAEPSATVRSTTLSTCRAESNTGMFGGNSNWRGPVWMPVNGLIVRALVNLYSFYGDEFKVAVSDRFRPLHDAVRSGTGDCAAADGHLPAR